MVINGITRYRAGAPPALRNPTNIRCENFRERERRALRFMVALATETLFPMGGGAGARRRGGDDFALSG